jgi:hypothetical protein
MGRFYKEIAAEGGFIVHHERNDYQCRGGTERRGRGDMTQISDETAAGAHQTTSSAGSLAGLAALLRSPAQQFKVG